MFNIPGQGGHAGRSRAHVGLIRCTNPYQIKPCGPHARACVGILPKTSFSLRFQPKSMYKPLNRQKYVQTNGWQQKSSRFHHARSCGFRRKPVRCHHPSPRGPRGPLARDCRTYPLHESFQIIPCGPRARAHVELFPAHLFSYRLTGLLQSFLDELCKPSCGWVGGMFARAVEWSAAVAPKSVLRRIDCTI